MFQCAHTGRRSEEPGACVCKRVMGMRLGRGAQDSAQCVGGEGAIKARRVCLPEQVGAGIWYKLGSELASEAAQRLHLASGGPRPRGLPAAPALALGRGPWGCGEPGALGARPQLPAVLEALAWGGSPASGRPAETPFSSAVLTQCCQTRQMKMQGTQFTSQV